jgi:hypothetical protein
MSLMFLIHAIKRDGLKINVKKTVYVAALSPECRAKP